MTKKSRLILGSSIFALMIFNVLTNIYTKSAELSRSSERGWEAMEINNRSVIYRVDREGPAPQLMVGDEIIELKAISPGAFPLLYRGEVNAPIGTNYTLTIRRNGQKQDISLITAAHPRIDLFFDYGFIFVRLIFIVTAVIVFLLRADDKQAWLLALMLGSFIGLFQPSTQLLSGVSLALIAIARFIGIVSLPLFLHFFLIFPERVPILRRFARVELWLYLPFVLFMVPTFGLQRLSLYFNIQMIPAWIYSFYPYRLIAVLCVIGYLLAGLIAMGVNYRAANINARRKLRVVFAGCAAGFLNLLLVFISEISGFKLIYPVLHDWLDKSMLLTLGLIPISFAYAIIRHQVIPVSLIIRRSVRYLLVARGSIVFGFLVVGLTLSFLLMTIFRYLNPHPIVGGMISATVAIAAWSIFRKLHQRYIAPVIDRRFFRTVYDAQQIIAELTESLRSTTSLSQLLELVASRIQSSLQTESVTIFLCDEKTGDYLSEYSCHYEAKSGRVLSRELPFRFPQGGYLLSHLHGSAKTLVLDLLDGSPKAIEEGSSFLSTEELQILQTLRPVLLMPLRVEALLGVIMLGSRLGDLPFSRDDKRLLLSVGGPTSFAIENSRLVERMIEDARHRQELEVINEQRAKELEEARRLQLSMLPMNVPQLPHLEIEAYMKPAAEVGGDYYDFHLADDGTLTTVVGDATGHGLKAGTVVTATKSLFNHLAPAADIIGIFEQSSLALKQMNLRSLYMALAMVKINGYHLTLSSAGMPPILIYRANTGQVEESSIKGVPLGSLITYRYCKQELELEPGDVIVMMSDGFAERFNANSEMLDYSTARDVLAKTGDGSPREIIDRLIKVSEEWAGGRPQDDDVTFVVLKVRS